MLVKSTHVPSRRPAEAHHISQTTPLSTATAEEQVKFTQMRLLGSGVDAHVYVGTSKGMHRVPVAQCASYADCCSCLEARDPYCGFDPHTQHCVPVTAGNRGRLLQDVVGGEVGECMSVLRPPSSAGSLPTYSTASRCFSSPSPPPSPPTTDASEDGTNATISEGGGEGGG